MKESRNEYLSFSRRRTARLKIGGVAVGGGAPISVQSMTKTDTRNVNATVAQIHELAAAGCEIVRSAVPDQEAAAALGAIVSRIDLPLVADIHFDYRLALKALEAGVDGLRINPGNIGSKARVREVVRAAAERSIPIRIGVNAGSLERDLLDRYGATPEAMVESALRHVAILEEQGFGLIKISLKASDAGRTLRASELLAEKVDYPFHAGITEAGGVLAGSVKSAAGLSLLLSRGLADTLRVSLTGPPVQEVRVAYWLLSALGIRSRGVTIISCPTCGRCEVDLPAIAARIERRLVDLKVPLTAAVMGCMVNGPGEAREADIGVACGRGVGVLFRGGRLLRKVREDELVEDFVGEVQSLAENLKKERGG